MEHFEVVRSARRTIAIEIKSGGRVIVRAPNKMRNADIVRFLQKKSSWIQKHLEQASKTATGNHFTDAEIRQLVADAKIDIPERVRHFAPIVGVTVGRITIRHQKTRWGSCSAKGNLNFNCLLMCCPEDVRDYVVVHELCHRKELNHSARFWAEVAQILPEYPKQRKWLREFGRNLIAKLDQ